MTVDMYQEIGTVEKIFNKGGFDTLRTYIDYTKSCFDLMAINNHSDMPISVLTKVVENIDNLSDKNLIELHLIANYVNAFPLIVGKENRRNNLEDNAIYFRFKRKIAAVNLRTLENNVLLKSIPQIIAKRGSYIAPIYGRKVKESREHKNISRRELSQLINISIKSISDYEKRKISMSNLDNIENLEKVLGISLQVPLNLFALKKKEQNEFDHPNNKPDLENDKYFAIEIYEKFEDIGLNQFWTNYSPFDVMLKIPKSNKENYNPLSLISAVFSSDNEMINHKIQFLSQFLKALHLMGTIIVEDQVDAKKCKIAGIPAIEKKELNDINNPKEFKKLVKKKTDSL